MEIKSQRAKVLPQWYGNNTHKKIVFTDWNILHSSEDLQMLKWQGVWSQFPLFTGSKEDILLQWQSGGALVMAVTNLQHLPEQDAKTSPKVYITTVLEKHKHVNHSLFHRNNWTFQQDSAPAHKAKVTHTSLSNSVPGIINTQDRPSQ